MSKKDNSQDSIYVSQIRTLLKRLFVVSPIKDSLLDSAKSFFHNQMSVQEVLDEFDQKQTNAEAEIAQGAKDAQTKLKQKLAAIEADKAAFAQQMRSDREERLVLFQNLCDEILELSEGNNFEESNRKSAQLLGTIQLLSFSEGARRAEVNEQNKPLYKAILCLRLLDRLLIDNKIEDAYIHKVVGALKPEKFKDLKSHNEEKHFLFHRDIKRSILTVALVQDIGTYHPEAIAILAGEDGKLDPHRTLDVDDRKKLLQINYRESLRFLTDGLGVASYMGNLKKERDAFVKNEEDKLVFMKRLLKKAVKPQNSIGNVIKVPQIYSSIVLSTKESYNYKLIPKVFQALNQNAERGTCSQMVVDALYKIVGMFPQGFGITHIPLDAHGHSLERYEYAIVNALYPKNPEEPNCRIATRQLCFIGYGTDLVVKKTENTYFKESAERLAKISRDRLLEILEKLVSNYSERADLDLIPRCWHARDFFSVKANQKLWNKSQSGKAE